MSVFNIYFCQEHKIVLRRSRSMLHTVHDTMTLTQMYSQILAPFEETFPCTKYICLIKFVCVWCVYACRGAAGIISQWNGILSSSG